MPVFTVEVEGRPIAAVGAEGRVEAEMFVSGDAFQSDLMCFESDGKPLWDGVSELHIRDAFEEERAVWERSFAKARAAGDTDDEDDWLVFLVPVRDPTDDAFDDD